MATLIFLHTFMLACGAAAANRITAEDALVAKRFYEHAPPELREILQDLDEDAEQVFQQTLKEQGLDEDGQHFFQQVLKEQGLEDEDGEDGESGEEWDPFADMVKEIEAQQVRNEEETSKDTIPKMVTEEFEKPIRKPASKPKGKTTSKPTSKPKSKATSTPKSKPESKPKSKPESKPKSKPKSETKRKPKSKPKRKPKSKPTSEPKSKPKSRDEAPNAHDFTEEVFFGNSPPPGGAEGEVWKTFKSPWALVADMQSEDVPEEIIQHIVADITDSIKNDLEVETKEESGQRPLTAEEMKMELPQVGEVEEMKGEIEEMKMELPHVGEAGAKNTEAYDGEPLMIRDESDASATTGFSQRTPLQLTQFSFNGNVLSRPKKAEDDVAHWIVQFCPHWWEPCEGLTDSFAKVGSKLEEQLNTGLFMRNIRFAIVDCAAEKVLCNQQEVETYPTTRHYYRGEFVAAWFGGEADHEKFYTKWLMQQARGIAPETPDGYVVGNLTNSTKGVFGSKEKTEKEMNTFPTFKEIAPDLLLVAVLVALCTRAVLSNVWL